MPGPLIGAVAAGLGSSIIGGIGASRAANAQSDAARAQMELQREMFDRQDQLGGQMFRQQAGDISRLDGENREAILNEALRSGELSRDLYRTGRRGYQDAYRANSRDLRQDERRGGVSLRDTGRENVEDLTRARNATGRDINRAERRNLREFRVAERRAFRELDPFADQGRNALSAYAYNLGLGEAPAGYAGLSLTPGAEFLLEQGRKDVEGGAAGAGGLYSGETMEELERMRQGIAATDRDNQMAHLFALLGAGQHAAGNISALRQEMAGNRAATRDTATGRRGDTRAQYTDAITGQRNYTTNALNDWRTLYGTAERGMRDDYADTMYGLEGDYVGNELSRLGTFTDRTLGNNQGYVSNIGTARTNRQNFTGQAAQGYASGGSTALANLGDAQASGAAGVANALTGGIGNGLSAYYMMGGQFPGLGGNGTQGNPIFLGNSSAYRPMPRPF